MNESPQGSDRGTAAGRWRLLRDVAVFQFKLIVDGVRDVLLVPASLAAAVLSLLGGGRRPRSPFYALLRAGRRSERWINLFAAVDEADATGAPRDLDRMLERVEFFVVDEYRHGRLTESARQRLRAALERLRRAADSEQ